MKVTYDSKDLIRAFDLATRVSPTAKGGAWDKAAGMVVKIDKDGHTTVLATNIDIAVHVELDATAIKDAPDDVVMWRMSALFIAQFVKKLSGAITVNEDTKKNALIFRSGKSKVEVPLMDPTDYPEFHQPPGTAPVDGQNLVAMAERIMWACDQNPSSGSPRVSGR